MATNIDKFIEPSELGGGNTPIGGIIMWQNPSAAAPNPTPPTGFEYCDGTAVTTVGSTMLGQNKPNLMLTSGGGAKGFPRGADVTVNYGSGTALVSGGADTHTHSTDSPGDHAHTMSSHTHQMAAHTHGTNSAGSHDHGGNTSGAVQDISSGSQYNGGVFYHRHQITSSGSHDHGSTQAASPTATDGPSTSNTGNAGSHTHTALSESNVPVFVELAYIIRVI